MIPRTKTGRRGVCGQGRSALRLTPADAKPLFISEAFREAARFDSGVHWLNAIERLGRAEIVTILGNVPSDRMSGEAAAFAKQILLINKNRLLDLKKDLQ